MRIISWNAYMAPTMLGRHRRRTEVHQALADFDNMGADIVLLQEFNSARVGPIGRFLYWLLADILQPGALQLLEYFMLVEGHMLPIFHWDNKAATLDWALENTAFKYWAASPDPTYSVDPGLIVLSRRPLTDVEHIAMRRDSGNCPGAIRFRIKDDQDRPLQVANVHLVPTLDNRSVPYRVINVLNAIYGISVDDLRREHATALLSAEPRYIVGGDFNAFGDEARDLAWQLGVQAIPSSAPTYADHTDRQLDWIMPRGVIASSSTLYRVPILYGSDHYPVCLDVTGM